MHLHMQGLCLLNTTTSSSCPIIYVSHVTDPRSLAMWQMLVYGAFSYMTFAAAIDQTWFHDTKDFWRGYPNHALS